MTDLDAPAAARPMTEAEIRWLRQRAEDDVRFPHANLSAHWMRRVLATLDAAVEERDRLRAAGCHCAGMCRCDDCKGHDPTIIPEGPRTISVQDPRASRAALHPEAGT